MGYAEIVKALIDHEGEVNAVDRYGTTALHLAARNGHSAVLNVLLNPTTERSPQIRSQLSVNQVPAYEREHPFKNRVDIGNTSHLIAAEDGSVEIANIFSGLSSTINTVCKGQVSPHDLAVEHGYAEIGKNLMFNRANINAYDNDRMTALYLACQNGHTTIVEILLDNHAIVDVMKQSAETPLYLAAKNGHAGVWDLLMRRGICDFVEIFYEYETPLHVAIEKGHTEVVEAILKHSCRISEKLRKDGEKLQENTKIDVMPVQLKKSDGRLVSAEIIWTERNTPLEIKRDSKGDAPLVWAARSNDPKMVQLLFSAGQRMYSETDIADSFRSIIKRVRPGYFAHGTLSDAIEYRKNFRKVAQFLINSSKFNVNHQDEQLNTFLHDMMRRDYVHISDLPKESNWLLSQIEIENDVIQLLLEKGADFNMKNSYGETPLIVASEYGCSDAIQTLFDWEEKSGIRLDLDARDQYGETALIKAAERQHVSVVRLLINHEASVNLQDYYGFTALHAAVYEPQKDWYDLHFFCEGLRKRKFDGDDYIENSSKDKSTCGKKAIDPYTVIEKLRVQLERDKKTTQIREELVKLLLANDETNVNVIDFGGNTPLDMAVKSFQRITSATFEALKNRGAILNLLEPEDEESIEVARVDERGRNPLHRLITSHVFFLENLYVAGVSVREERIARFDLMVDAILLRPENFRHLATTTDNKGRTPLHCAVMTPSYSREQDRDLVRVLLKLGCNVNSADMYGKTPLHYAEKNEQFELLVRCGADENTKDKTGHTPKDLKKLRKSVTVNEELPIKNQALYLPTDIDEVLNHVTELSNRKMIETIRIYSQSPRPQESSEEAIWRIWNETGLYRVNRRIRQLKPSVQHFIERLADGIKEKDGRFECQPTLVGSANEETKVVISADFDFNFKLNKFSQICDPFPHPLGPKGYFQLRRKSSEDTRCRSDEWFDSFFNSDQCLLTNEVNSRFKIILDEVLSDPAIWQGEHLFEWNVIDKDTRKFRKRAGLCRTLRLKMINPFEDGEGGFLFVDISIDIVACVHFGYWWPDDPLPVGICSILNTDDCTMVFDRPRFDPSKPRRARFLFSETFARISFAPLESRIVKESSLLIKAAYIVCKIMLYDQPKTTHQLKTCLLFCMEALDARNGSETRNEDEITPKQLLFWVERIMFCFLEFSRHDFYPYYFMSSFKHQVAKVNDNDIFADINAVFSFSYSMIYDLYLDLCPDDTAIDIPIVPRKITVESLNANHDPKWEQFDREEFIRKLSSRSSS